MKYLLTAGALILTLTLSAQQYHEDEIEEPETIEVKIKEKKKREEIKTLTKGDHNGGFFGLTFKATEFNNEPIITTGARMGFIFGRTLGFGIEAHGLVPTAKFDYGTPDTKAVLLGGYGGIFLEPVIFSNQVLHLTFPVTGGAGWMGLHEDWEGNNEMTQLLEDDIYWYAEPGIALEINVSKHFRIGVGVTQRFTKEMDLSIAPSNAFDNRNYFFTMKFGNF